MATTCRRWVFTVCGEMHSRLATAPFVSPPATSSDTARPVVVRLYGGQPGVRARRPSGRMDEELQRSQDRQPDIFRVLR